MPYKNKRNEAVAEQVRTFSQNHVNREKEINDFSTNYEIPSQLESVVMRQPEVHGGSGFAAATVQDLGFEPTLGATSAEGKPKRKPRKSVYRSWGRSISRGNFWGRRLWWSSALSSGSTRYARATTRHNTSEGNTESRRNIRRRQGQTKRNSA